MWVRFHAPRWGQKTGLWVSQLPSLHPNIPDEQAMPTSPSSSQPQWGGDPTAFPYFCQDGQSQDWRIKPCSWPFGTWQQDSLWTLPQPIIPQCTQGLNSQQTFQALLSSQLFTYPSQKWAYPLHFPLLARPFPSYLLFKALLKLQLCHKVFLVVLSLN